MSELDGNQRLSGFDTIPWIALIVALFTSFSVKGFEASYGSLSPEERELSLASHYTLEFPGREGIYSLVIMLPGCMGWHPHHTKWQKELLRMKFAVLHIDSFKARGLNNPAVLKREVCSGKQVTGDERAGDVISVLSKVWKNPRIRPGTTVLMGWSHGGWSALDLLVSLESRIRLPNLSYLPKLDVTNFKAALLYYPWCGAAGLNWSGNIPTTIQGYLFHGSRDVITSPRECKRRIQRSSDKGGEMEFVQLRGAAHWFDNHASQFFDKKAYMRSFSGANRLLQSLENNPLEANQKRLNGVLGGKDASDDLIDLFEGVADP